MKRSQHTLTALIALASLTLTVLAHGDDEHGEHGTHGEHGEHGMDMDMDMSHAMTSVATNGTVDESYYFAYAPHRGWLILHVLTMVVGWIGLMPLGTASIPFPFSSVR
jgi:hypothetical protein